MHDQMQIPAGCGRQGSAGKMTNGGRSPGGPSRTRTTIKVRHQNAGKTIFYAARTIYPRVSSETPNWCALTAVAPTVRFNALEIFATPTFFLASDFNSRTSDGVHARLTDFFFLAISGSSFQEARLYHTKMIRQSNTNDDELNLLDAPKNRFTTNAWLRPLLPTSYCR